MPDSKSDVLPITPQSIGCLGRDRTYVVRVTTAYSAIELQDNEYSRYDCNTLGGSRTHKIWFLRPARMPVPSQGHETFELTKVFRELIFPTRTAGLEPAIFGVEIRRAVHLRYVLKVAIGAKMSLNKTSGTLIVLKFLAHNDIQRLGFVRGASA